MECKLDFLVKWAPDSEDVIQLVTVLDSHQSCEQIQAMYPLLDQKRDSGLKPYKAGGWQKNFPRTTVQNRKEAISLKAPALRDYLADRFLLENQVLIKRLLCQQVMRAGSSVASNAVFCQIMA